jgi:hypothetical protein
VRSPWRYCTASLTPTASRPGRGWIYVRAARLDGREIVAALERGDFYASTGVELADVAFANNRVTLAVKVESSSKYRVRFIGRDGRLLKEVPSDSASYDVRGDEGYVRAVVYESNGKKAWTQPVLVGQR